MPEDARRAAFPDRLSADAARIEELAASCLARPTSLNQAMVYALQGGKMLRGFLVLESCRLFHVADKPALHAALSIECMHAYSLIHDDLPCMDNDDLRRGKPTVHRKWDEATAVLAGDALQSMAFELLIDPCIFNLNPSTPGTISAVLVAELGQAAGHKGMVLGQMMDIEAESAASPLTLDQIERLQQLKTGRLLKWSVGAGATLAQADARPLNRYGDCLGLAFQIWDDVLDVEGHAAEVGKAVGKDAGAGKATFVSLLGLDGAKRRAEMLVTEACDALSCYGDTAAALKQAAHFVIARRN